MPLSNEQAYKRIEQFLLPLNFEELCYLEKIIEEAMMEAFECENVIIHKKLRNIRDKIEQLKAMKGNQ
jgi:hypothetical protein